MMRPGSAHLSNAAVHMARQWFTKLQGQYLAFIRSYERLHGVPPAEADLQRFFAVTAPAVHDMVVRLQQAGLVSRSPGRARSIRVRIPDADLPALEDRHAGRTPAARPALRRLSIARDALTDDSTVEPVGFPTTETFIDCCGTAREFDLQLLERGITCFLRANERVAGEGGYAFAAFAESDPFLALGRLRRKISDGLATRYLAPGDGPPLLSHGVVGGHISSGGVVVDGRHLGYDELARILEGYEAWRFTLTVDDGYDAS